MDAGQIPRGESRLLGTTLSDRYVLRSVLGRGSFGTTFLGEHLILNQPVVIKLLDAGEPGATELFRKEVAITRKLEHPNIVKVLDAGIDENGQTYSVTEWVDGKDLGEILRSSGPLGTNNSLQVATGIAETLAYVHSQGVLHRDLKPSNILIPGWPSDPKYRNPKILDFGVAGRLLAGGHTQVGAVFGTPQYMSPEQIKGESQSPATDVYGLGLLLFEMLTGRAPHNRAEGAVSLFRAVLEEEFPEPELKDIQPELANLIRQCVRRNPEERLSVDAVIKELRRLETPNVKAAPSAAKPVNLFAALGSHRLLWLTLLGFIFVVAVFAYSPLHKPGHSFAFLGGLLLMWASIAGGFWLRRWLGRRSSAKSQAYDLVLGAKARVDLTATIALQLDDLVAKLHAIDDRILAGTVALMLDEYGRATEAKDRQSALMNVVALSEKLAHRLSPWYERYKEVIASAVAVLGGVSGLLTAINSLLGAHK
jgi:hypothetical protein